jgi:RNA polymerase sigma-70 factor (ECF subfamily)
MDADIQHLVAGGHREQAFELLLNHYQNKVFRLALTFLRNPAKAEDAAQDVFLKLWRSLGDYNAEASLSTWIYAITRNTCLNQLRRDSYRDAVSLTDTDAPQPARESSAPAALDCHALLDSLPEKDRHVLTLFYLEEKSHQEVAAMLGRPVGTIKSDIHRARKAMAQLVIRRSTP